MSVLRIVDDGAVISTVWCKNCCKEALQHMWGRDQTISEEEEGQTIRFGGMLEVIQGDDVFLRPYYHASPVGPALRPPKTRFIPACFQPHPRFYTRSLFLYTIHRVGQISRRDEREAERAILEISYTLHRLPCCYSWKTLRRAISGTRFRWATPAIKKSRDRLLVLVSSEP